MLGAVLVDNAAFNSAAEILDPRRLLPRGAPPRLRRHGRAGRAQPADRPRHAEGRAGRAGRRWRRSGGAAYLAALVDGMPRITNVEQWSRIIKEKAVLRNLIHAGNRIAQSCLRGGGRGGGHPGPGRRRRSSTSPSTASARASSGIREIVKESFRTIDQLSQSQGAGHRAAHRLRRPRRDDERPAEGRPHHRGRAPGHGQDVVLPERRAVRRATRPARRSGVFSLEMAEGAARPAHALRGRACRRAPAAHGQPPGEGLGAAGQGLRGPVAPRRSSSTTRPPSRRWRCAPSAAA